MGMIPARRAAIALLFAAAFAGLAACSEKPQRMYSEDGQEAYNPEVGGALAERTRNQGEPERIGN